MYYIANLILYFKPRSVYHIPTLKSSLLLQVVPKLKPPIPETTIKISSLIYIFTVAYRPVAGQRPRNGQRAQPFIYKFAISTINIGLYKSSRSLYLNIRTSILLNFQIISSFIYPGSMHPLLAVLLRQSSAYSYTSIHFAARNFWNRVYTGALR